MTTYLDEFPVGAFIDYNSIPAGWQTTLVPALQAAGLPYAIINNLSPYLDSQSHLTATLDAGGIKTVLSPWGNLTAAGNDGLTQRWFNQVNTSRAQAPAVAQPIVDAFAGLSNVLAYNLQDDASSLTGLAAKASRLAEGFAYADASRPASGMYVDVTGLMNHTGPLTFTYEYPCGQKPDGSLTPEGDFHRATYAGEDFVTRVRAKLGASRGRRCWLTIQAHGARTGFSTTQPSGLREPTPRELRKMFWVAIGEGAKGISWFAAHTQAFWRGLLDPSYSDHLSVVTELSNRLTPVIRSTLLTLSRYCDIFTTAGGGNAVNGYANAYCSTFRAVDGTYHVVVANEALTTSSIIIKSGLSGTLVNWETGQRTPVGQSVSLPALDGSIWRLDPVV